MGPNDLLSIQNDVAGPLSFYVSYRENVVFINLDDTGA